MDNKSLALEFFRKHLADPEWTERNVHDEFEMSYEADPETFPRAGLPPLSKANLQSFGATARQIWGTGDGAVRLTPYGVTVADGDHVVSQVLVTGARADGKRLNNRTAYVLQFKDGKVYRAWLHEDTAYIMHTWGDEVEVLDGNRID